MRVLQDYKGNSREVDCLGCARERGEITQGSILHSDYFDAHQDFEIPIPGFVIISSRRHIKSFDEFTDQEQLDFMAVLKRVRSAMRTALQIETVYFVQEEDTSHHFHAWLFPRYDWMEEKFGRKIQSVRPIMEYSREHMKTPENLAKVEKAFKKLAALFR